MKIMIINGPNMNMLGSRDKTQYGTFTYDDLVSKIKSYCDNLNIKVDFYQSNVEGYLVDTIQEVYKNNYDGLVINPAGYTHTSIAIRDALEIVKCKKVEVHLSNILEREDFRKIDLVKDVVDETIMGKGINGYFEAIDYLVK